MIRYDSFDTGHATVAQLNRVSLNDFVEGIGFWDVQVNQSRFKRRILYVPNPMQMRKIYCFRSFALDSAHVKCDV